MATSNTTYEYDSTTFSQAAYSSAATTNPEGKSQRYTELAESNNDDGTFVQRQYEESGKPTIQSVNQIPPFKHEDPRVDERMMRKIGQVSDLDPTRPVFGQVEQIERANEQVQEHPERHHEALEDLAHQPARQHGNATDDFEQHHSARHRNAINEIQQEQHRPTRHHRGVDNMEQQHPLRHQEGVQDLEQQYIARPNNNINDPKQPHNNASATQHNGSHHSEQQYQPATNPEINDDRAHHHRSAKHHQQHADRYDHQHLPADQVRDVFAPTDPTAPMPIPPRDPFGSQEQYEKDRDKYWDGRDGFATGGPLRTQEMQREQELERESTRARERELERKREADRLYQERMEDEYARREGGA